MAWWRWPARTLLLALVLAAVIQCGLIAAAAGFAALGTARAESWTDGADMMASWHAVQRQLRLAARLDPWAADYRAALGRLAERAAEQDVEVRVDHLEQARTAYAAALRLNPGDGVIWARRAGIALALRRDAEAVAALTQAVALAPWEPEAQQVVTRLGVTHWLQLSRAAREQVLVMAGNGLIGASAHRRREVLQLLRASGFLTLVCDHLTSRGHASAQCPR